jgi:peroxiredoxin
MRKSSPKKSRKPGKLGGNKGTFLGPGRIAPNFSLNSTPDQKVSLQDFRGQPVVLAFYPADWSPVCTDQLSLYAEVMPEFKKHNAELLAISVDNVWSHLAFVKDRKLNFPVLSDFEPKGAISRSYGAFNEKTGESERALFVMDRKGVISWSHLSPDGVNPGADGILSALASLSKKEPGQKSEVA